MCSYGLSPFAQGEPCYALIWEGILGALYTIDQDLVVTKTSVIDNPGLLYSLLYAIADPTAPTQAGYVRYSNPGKLMALAAYSDRSPMSKIESSFFERLLTYTSNTVHVKKTDFEDSLFFNIGVEHPDFKNFAGKASDKLFDLFAQAAQKVCRDDKPLLIGGGCGLNCEWNTKWMQSGLFSDIFVPPIANDSGAALGTAIDARYHYTGNSKLRNVYSGLSFVYDDADLSGFSETKMRYDEVADFILEDRVIAWVQNNYEMVLAAPETVQF